MKELLERAYYKIASHWNITVENNDADLKMNNVIKSALEKFVMSCNMPAIWCYGNHTKMLMADFIYELKTVKCIIDEGHIDNLCEGFQVIRKEELIDNGIDGIIISSFRYKEEIKEIIKEKYPNVRYLDIYDVLEQQGIFCSCEYYNYTHPYEHYKRINLFQRKLKQCESDNEKCRLYEEIIRLYVFLKDFLSAINYMKEYLDIDASDYNKKRFLDLSDIYDLQLNAAMQISRSNVLMLCIDGLRRKDIMNGLMPQLKDYIDANMVWFDNAYSISTSTYESLLPAYSENFDLRTKYYASNTIKEENCRFVKKAIEQKRKIFFYTDATVYVQSSAIKVKDKLQTASEKLWDFILDAVDEKNGLFYVHILYESHFSYPNPYTNSSIVAEGTNILFDYLSKNGGQLRADYNMQHIDALRYLDDIISPFVKALSGDMVLYADHGNVIFNDKDMVKGIPYSIFAFGEDLIRVPIAIRKHEQEPKRVSSLMSLSEINNIIISLLDDDIYKPPFKTYVKVQRSELYNPDFRYLYKKASFEKGLLAYEMFIFASGYKLVIYASGEKELYNINDEKISDDAKTGELYQVIKNEITVVEE